MLNATDPNLDAFKASNGKLIIWHGWSDPALSALGTIKYVDQVQARDPASRDYLRTFMMPGVLHCAGGPGPDRAELDQGARRLGREGRGARAGDCEQERRREGRAHASALRVSAARGLQRQRQHRRREEFYLLEVTT